MWVETNVDGNIISGICVNESLMVNALDPLERFITVLC